MYINILHNNAVTLDELLPGAVFSRGGNQYYMKIYDKMSNNNAVNLYDGEVCYFDEMNTVYTVDYEFTIK